MAFIATAYTSPQHTWQPDFGPFDCGVDFSKFKMHFKKKKKSPSLTTKVPSDWNDITNNLYLHLPTKVSTKTPTKKTISKTCCSSDQALSCQAMATFQLLLPVSRFVAHHLPGFQESLAANNSPYLPNLLRANDMVDLVDGLDGQNSDTILTAFHMLQNSSTNARCTISNMSLTISIGLHQKEGKYMNLYLPLTHKEASSPFVHLLKYQLENPMKIACRLSEVALDVASSRHNLKIAGIRDMGWFHKHISRDMNGEAIMKYNRI